jgi:hypothetical protein
MYGFTREDIDLEAIRERIKKMNDDSALRARCGLARTAPVTGNGIPKKKTAAATFGRAQSVK